MSNRYVLISPCRDEAEYLETTIRTVGEQTTPPTKWIIVDDGSTDATPEILTAAAEEYPFIEVVRREDRGERAVGPGVIDAFYAGLGRVDLDDFDYVCKFDCDLEMPPKYFEKLMADFDADPLLGTKSGKLYIRDGDRLVHEYCGDENSVGPAKFYRVECFRAIDGFVREVCWDGIDGHLCRMRGWVAESEDDPDTRIIHLRRMGSSYRSLWTGRQRWGRGKWFMGSAWYYVFAASVFRAFEKPYIVNGLGIFVGYIKSMLTRVKRYEEPGFRRFLRRFERRVLFAGKSAAAREFNGQVRSQGRSGSDA